MQDNFLRQLQDQPLATVADYYANCLATSPTAFAYLERNALLSKQTSTEEPAASALRLTVGFCDRTLGKYIPKKQVKLGRHIRTQLEQLGIYRTSGHEHFRGMVTVPLHTTGGELTGLYGRRIDRHGEGQAEHVIGCGIFNATALNQFDELIIADTVLDAWTLCAAGHSNAICTVDYQLQIAELSKIKRVLLCGDSIDCEAFAGCELHRMSLPIGHTCHSYALERRAESAPLAKLIRAAAWHRASENTQPAAPCGKGFQPVRAEQPESLPDRPQASQGPSASPTPPMPTELDVQSTDSETTISIETRRWRIRGLDRNTVPGILKVNVLVFNERCDRFHVDTFDVYHARSRKTFLAEAADEIGEAESQLRSDLGKVLLKLEQLQQEQEQQSKTTAASAKPLSEEEQSAALELLRDERLLDRILDDFETCGIVGERTGKLVGYLAATSRLLDKPLGLIIQSSSAAGKSSLADAILNFMPAEQCFTCSAMTSQSLYYLGNENLQHKILCIAEQEGVRDASYQLKILQSEGSLSLIATSKEKGSGRTSTQRYSVAGPVAVLMTTTATDIDPELLNRSLVTAVDESLAQTAAIHAQQRFARTLAGFEQKQRAQQIMQLHQNAQRLLRPLRIYNPYAQQLAFIGSQTRYRRDHEKYLTLINTITLLHQHQRDIKTSLVHGQSIEYIEVTRQDIDQANRIADWALGRSIDELPGPTRRLLSELFDWVSQQADQQKIQSTQFTFTRREAREGLQWNATHLRNHLERLAQHEYVVSHGRGQGKLHRYSLLYDGRGRDGQPSLLGLVDAASLVEPESISMTGNLALQ